MLMTRFEHAIVHAHFKYTDCSQASQTPFDVLVAVCCVYVWLEFFCFKTLLQMQKQ